MAGKATERRGFGQIRKLPSGRYQARYSDPDGRLSQSGDPVRHTAPSTFDTREDAEAWLSDERKLITLGLWEDPKTRAAKRRGRITFATYGNAWIEHRELKPRTRSHYQSLLDQHLVPTFGQLPLTTITPEAVKAWHALMGPSRPTLRAHAYSLLRSIMADAERDEIITRNPCHIRGAGYSKRVHQIRPATLPEIEQLVAAMPDRFKLMTLFAAWCGLRFGELAELRRKDIDVKAGVIRIRRAVTRVDGKTIVGTPKSSAGIRDVAIPPHLLPMVKQHLADNITGGREGLLFPGADGRHLAPSTLYGKKTLRNRQGKITRQGWGFYEARAIAGREDLRWHDLRHTGAVLAAATGATLAELMGRLGHSTVSAALKYQHAAQGRDAEIARKLSELVGRG